jgi:hypothetical protein
LIDLSILLHQANCINIIGGQMLCRLKSLITKHSNFNGMKAACFASGIPQGIIFGPMLLDNYKSSDAITSHICMC